MILSVLVFGKLISIKEEKRLIGWMGMLFSNTIGRLES